MANVKVYYAFKHLGEKTRWVTFNENRGFDLVSIFNKDCLLTKSQAAGWAKKFVDPRYKQYKISLDATRIDQ